MDIWTVIEQRISQAIGANFTATHRSNVGGGCINDTSIIANETTSFFVKLNNASLLSMFEAEKEGLTEILSSKTIRVPRPICCGTANNSAYLILEHIDMNTGKGVNHEKLGRQLAAMHLRTETHYGWHRNNTIGSTEQINSPQESWIDFWGKNRLLFQLRLAEQKGYSKRLIQRGENLVAHLGDILDDHRPQASLLHGDLWSGNFGGNEMGDPVIFDPAVYYGDRETDLAMTELFGGFSPRFYAAYQETYPLDSGYTTRKTLYNLYHILNHLNLFGEGYLTQAESMIKQLLNEIR